MEEERQAAVAQSREAEAEALEAERHTLALARLLGMGFPHATCEDALARERNDVERDAEMLLEQQAPSPSQMVLARPGPWLRRSSCRSMTPKQPHVTRTR